MVVEFLLGVVAGTLVMGVAWRIHYQKEHLFVVG